MTFGVQVSFILCCSALHSRQLKSSKDSEALNKCDSLFTAVQLFAVYERPSCEMAFPLCCRCVLTRKTLLL